MTRSGGGGGGGGHVVRSAAIAHPAIHHKTGSTLPDKIGRLIGSPLDLLNSFSTHHEWSQEAVPLLVGLITPVSPVHLCLQRADEGHRVLRRIHQLSPRGTPGHQETRERNDKQIVDRMTS